MSSEIVDFKEIEVTSEDGLVKVVLEYIGEGNDGDYDPDDPDDEPLLRFSLYRRDDGDDRLNSLYFEPAHDGWLSVSDGSYCTQLSARADRELLTKAANHILDEVRHTLSDCGREKRLYELLSWIELEE